MKKNISECSKCGCRWILRVENPKSCTRCKVRFDRGDAKAKIETKEFKNREDWIAYKKELDKWNNEHPL
jgi:hypothetical protein